MNDTEQPFELVLQVKLRGYGKTQHKQKLLEKVVKELGLQFDHVVVTEASLLDKTTEKRISWRGE